MNELKEKIKLEDMIYEVRGKQVMLDSDLAKLYQCKNGTKDINKAVNRNIERFPEDFYFQLTKDEYYTILRFQFGTLKLQHGKFSKYLPYVFTEQGVAMLSSVLRTQVASKISISIMRTFVYLRKYISNGLLEQKYVSNMLIKHDNEIKLLQESFTKLENKKLVNEIYFNGQIYDAYSKIIDILNEAKEKVIIIDNYADKSVLDIISKLNIEVLLITKKFSLLKEIDIKKYNAQYHNLTIRYDETFHDRYFILDNKKVYHLGTSINHAGSKTFSINKIEDTFIINSLIDNIDRKN